MNILNKLASFPDKGVPGAWNDLDMLEVGNGGMTDDGSYSPPSRRFFLIY